MPIYYSKKIADIVSSAYDRPDGPEHRLIKRKAREWIGLDRKFGPSGWRRRFVHRTLKAARHIARQTASPGLGVHPIGHAELVIECFKTDTNTAAVYLYGFSDNIRFFELYGRHLRQGQVAIDVGANVGIHTLVMSRLVGSSGEVFSYEPSKTIFNRLKHNLEINEAGNVTALDFAVGAQSGLAGFADLSDETNIGKSHVDPSSNDKVMMTTLDEEHYGSKSIGLIKIDVEGSEMDVLKGGRKLLEVHRPVIFMEFNSEDYLLGEVMDLIPYKCLLLGIPNTYYRREIPISPSARTPGSHNIVIIPD